MPRPHKCRCVHAEPASVGFRPTGRGGCCAETVVLRWDELEAVRLADLEGLYQEDAAARMKVSRPTFSRLVQDARHKIALALVNGRMLAIEGGNVSMPQEREFGCSACGHTFSAPHGTPRPACCPKCECETIHRSADDERGGRRRRRGCGCCGTGHAHGRHGQGRAAREASGSVESGTETKADA